MSDLYKNFSDNAQNYIKTAVVETKKLKMNSYLIDIRILIISFFLYDNYYELETFSNYINAIKAIEEKKRKFKINGIERLSPETLARQNAILLATIKEKIQKELTLLKEEYKVKLSSSIKSDEFSEDLQRIFKILYNKSENYITQYQVFYGALQENTVFPFLDSFFNKIGIDFYIIGSYIANKLTTKGYQELVFKFSGIRLGETLPVYIYTAKDYSLIGFNDGLDSEIRDDNGNKKYSKIPNPKGFTKKLEKLLENALTCKMSKMQIEINNLYYNRSQEKIQKRALEEMSNQVKTRKHNKNKENYIDQIEFFKNEQKSFENPYQKKFDQEFLNLYTVDLTEKARTGKLDTVIGRTDEIQKTIEILSRRRKNNPILLGEPGVGKTAIAEGLAQLIVQKRVPTLLKNKTIVSLNLAGLLAGTQFRGQFEEKLKTLMNVIKEKKDIIVFIDEIHTLVGAGKTAENSGDAAQILKPALARGEFQCIGATTNEEYRKYFKEDAALDRRFQIVKINETSVEDSIIILREIKSSYELFHKVKYAESALNAAVNFSVQYIQDRFLPDKAIDLLDEAGAYTRIHLDQKPNRMEELQIELERCIKVHNYYSKMTNLTKISETELNELIKNIEETINTINNLLKEESRKISENAKNNIITAQTIATIIARSTGIPVDKISKAESDKLMDLEKLLDGKVIGQHDAVSTVAKAIKRARAGLRNSNRPIASFIFAGPTGVGKTELAKTLALNLFGSEKDIIRFDMSEFMEKHCVSKLIGSPPGYIGHNEGGQLTEAVRLKPYSIILFDEIEKAHPDIFNLFLQLLDEGRLTDSKGKTVDFKNTLIILTSNIGASMIDHFSKKLMISDKIKNIEEIAEIKKNISDSVNQQLKAYFKPEFLNRLDDIIIFQSLQKKDLWDIAYLMIYDLIDEMEQKGIILNVSESVYKKIVKKGYNPAYGARPLRRAITTLLEDNLAEVLIGQELIPGMIINVNTDSNDNIKVAICPPVEDDNFFYY